MPARFEVTYHVRCPATEVEARARAIAVEQSVEMPVEAIDETRILRDIVGEVRAIHDRGDGSFSVRVALATETVGNDAGQLLNMVFGNSSWHHDVRLHDIEVPEELERLFGGPRHGLDGVRARIGAGRRALTCSALKPQGLPSSRLADLAGRFAEGGIDAIKDDHGLADQTFSPFAERVAAITETVRRANPDCVYMPSLTGSLDAMRKQLAIASDHGVTAAMVPPMLLGAANLQRLVAEHPGIAFMAHPTFGGSMIDPALLIGKLFRLFGCDMVVFPNYGGRFGYSTETCRRLATAARGPAGALRPAIPVPAGGMTPGRVPEMLEFYGPDTMLLIGGGLLAARERLTEATAEFTRAVAEFRYVH